jgi:hypothetical protein
MEYQVEVRSFLPLANRKSSKSNFRNDYLNSVEKNIDFVLSTYKERRDWSDDFLKEVRKQAIQDADRTTYFLVRPYDNFEADKTWATLKVIRSSENQKEELLLPLEQALNIRLPFNNGFKFEPGNFSVPKEHYKNGMSQLIIHLSRFTKEILHKNPMIDPKSNLFYTYADKQSRLMYRSLGFKIAPGLEKSITKDGKEWWVLGISGEDLANLPKRIHQGREVWSEEDKITFQEVSDIFENFMDTSTVQSNRMSHDIESKLEKKPTLVAFVTAEEHLRKEIHVKKVGIIFDNFGDDGSVLLPIPVDDIPLRNGTEIKFRSQYMSAFYEDGFLNVKYEFNNQKQTLKLEIDPGMTKAKSAQLTAIEKEKEIMNFSVLF